MATKTRPKTFLKVATGRKKVGKMVFRLQKLFLVERGFCGLFTVLAKKSGLLPGFKIKSGQEKTLNLRAFPGFLARNPLFSITNIVEKIFFIYINKENFWVFGQSHYICGYKKYFEQGGFWMIFLTLLLIGALGVLCLFGVAGIAFEIFAILLKALPIILVIAAIIFLLLFIVWI